METLKTKQKQEECWNSKQPVANVTAYRAFTTLKNLYNRAANKYKGVASPAAQV